MRILFVSDKKIWRGVSVWMLKLSHFLTRHDHEVHILANPENPYWQKNHSGISSDALKIRFDFDPLAIIQLTHYIKRHQIQLLILNHRREVQVGGIAARLAGIPTIRRIGRQDDFRSKAKDKWCHTRLIDHSVTTCAYIARDIEASHAYVAGGSISHIHNFREPYDPDPSMVIALRKEWRVKQGQLVIGTTVALEKEKGVIPLIKALHAIKDQIPDWRLIICGEGTLLHKIQETIRELQLGDRVHLAGHVSNSVAKSACYDIAVLNSSMEGISHTLLEYMASGRSIVSTDSGGLAEVVRHDHNAIVVKWSDQSALERGLLTLARDPEMRARLGNQAKQDLSQSFSTEIRCAEWQDFLAKAIQEHQ